MKKAAVIGNPVSHSLSPMIHAHWLDKHGIAGTYTAIDISPGHLEGEVQSLIDDGFAGFNVTLPHKIRIMEMCDVLDDTAKIIGAVNTVAVREGRLHGYNTDSYGFIENLRATHPLFKKEKAVVLGAGGAARAIVHGLKTAGVSAIVLSNRTRAKAEALAETAAGVTVEDWGKENLEDAGLIVNASSLGMVGQPDLAIDLNAAPRDCVVYDIVYRPLMTSLLREARRQSLPVVTGLGMLLHQARPAFSLWFGIFPDVTADLSEKLEKASQS